MKKVIVESWANIPFIGLQCSKFTDALNAFEYAESEYLPYGYNVAYFATDIKTLFLTRN